MRVFAGAVVAVVLSGMSGSVRAQELAPQVFHTAAAGIAVARPAGWHTASRQAVQENRERVRLADAELQEAIRSSATAPLFAFTKYPEPHPGVNPSIQVILRAAGAFVGAPATETLRAAAGVMQKGFSDFTFLQEIEATELSSFPAAHMRVQYTLTTANGAACKVLSRLWLVPRGGFMFLLGMSGPADGADVSEAEFAVVLASVKIER